MYAARRAVVAATRQVAPVTVLKFPVHAGVAARRTASGLAGMTASVQPMLKQLRLWAPQIAVVGGVAVVRDCGAGKGGRCGSPHLAAGVRAGGAARNLHRS